MKVCWRLSVYIMHHNLYFNIGNLVVLIKTKRCFYSHFYNFNVRRDYSTQRESSAFENWDIQQLNFIPVELTKQYEAKKRWLYHEQARSLVLWSKEHLISLILKKKLDFAFFVYFTCLWTPIPLSVANILHMYYCTVADYIM